MTVLLAHVITWALRLCAVAIVVATCLMSGYVGLWIGDPIGHGQHLAWTLALMTAVCALLGPARRYHILAGNEDQARIANRIRWVLVFLELSTAIGFIANGRFANIDAANEAVRSHDLVVDQIERIKGRIDGKPVPRQESVISADIDLLLNKVVDGRSVRDRVGDCTGSLSTRSWTGRTYCPKILVLRQELADASAYWSDIRTLDRLQASNEAVEKPTLDAQAEVIAELLGVSIQTVLVGVSVLFGIVVVLVNIFGLDAAIGYDPKQVATIIEVSKKRHYEMIMENLERPRAEQDFPVDTVPQEPQPTVPTVGDVTAPSVPEPEVPDRQIQEPTVTETAVAKQQAKRKKSKKKPKKKAAAVQKSEGRKPSRKSTGTVPRIILQDALDNLLIKRKVS